MPVKDFVAVIEVIKFILACEKRVFDLGAVLLYTVHTFYAYKELAGWVSGKHESKETAEKFIIVYAAVFKLVLEDGADLLVYNTVILRYKVDLIAVLAVLPEKGTPFYAVFPVP